MKLSIQSFIPTESSAKQSIELGLKLLKMRHEELQLCKKTDWKKGLVVSLIRKNSMVRLDWISKQLNMGVRSSVTRAEESFRSELLKDKKMQKRWMKFVKNKNMQRINADPFSISLSKTILPKVS